MTEEEDHDKVGMGNNRWIFVELIQIVWAEGEIPQQMASMMVMLLLKRGGDYHDIGLLEPFWKVIEILMDGRMDAIDFHDCLHGFLKDRGTGMATIKAKLAQQLAFIEQEALYSTSVDLKRHTTLWIGRGAWKSSRDTGWGQTYFASSQSSGT